MKLILFLCSFGSFAHAAGTVCGDVLKKNYQVDGGRSRGWEMTGWDELTRKEAIQLIQETTCQDNGEALVEAKRRGREFFRLYWDTYGNSGASVVIAAKNPCRVILEIVDSAE